MLSKYVPADHISIGMYQETDREIKKEGMYARLKLSGLETALEKQ